MRALKLAVFMSSCPSAAGGSGGSCVSDQTFCVCKGLDLEHAASGTMGLKIFMDGGSVRRFEIRNSKSG